jgi:hypothetical protein
VAGFLQIDVGGSPKWNRCVIERSASEASMKSILDPSFRYTPSASTDLRKTFARVRREMRRQAQAAEVESKVAMIFPRQRRAESQPR